MKWLTLAAAAANCLHAASSQQYDRLTMTPGPNVCEDRQPVNIAIIGAGAGGASTAYHLHRYATSANIPLNITIFERNAYIGGRSTTVNAYDDPSQPVELGASIFVQVNRILRDAVDEFGLSTGNDDFDDSDDDDIPGAALAIWDGEVFVFIQQRASTGWWDIARIFWKYGLAPLRTIRLMKTIVGKFLAMYDEPRFPFASLTQVARDVGLSDVVAATGEDLLTQNGIKGDFGRHVVQASTRVNYAQNLRYIHGLEAMVCMAAENAMSVEGGNWRIFDGMVKASRATMMLETSVTGLKMRDDSTYLLSYDTVSESEDQEPIQNTQAFDAVVLAAPYQFANLTISPETKHCDPDPIPYVSLHVTLFTSFHLLSPTFFNLSSEEPAPRVVLTTLPASENPEKGPDGVGSPGFFSISLLRSVTNPSTGKREYLYKIFSPLPPTSDFLSRLLGVSSSAGTTSYPAYFSEANSSNVISSTNDDQDENDLLNSKTITWLHRKKWQSYPYEYPRITFEEIKLAPNLWYTSGIENFVSTMETSALMGRNVAKLVVEELQEREEIQLLTWAMTGEEGKMGRSVMNEYKDLMEGKQDLR